MPFEPPHVNRLIAGTNITLSPASGKGAVTVNSTSVATPPAAPTGSVQFDNAGAFASDSNLFWDNSGKCLGVGTNTPSVRGDFLAGSTSISPPSSLSASLVAESLIAAPYADAATFIYGPMDTGSCSANENPYSGSNYVCDGRTNYYTILSYKNIGGTLYTSPGGGTAQCNVTDSVVDYSSYFTVGLSWSPATNGDGSGVDGYIVTGPFGQIDVGNTTSWTDAGTGYSATYTGFSGITASGQTFAFYVYNIAYDPTNNLYTSAANGVDTITDAYNNGSQFWIQHNLSGGGGGGWQFYLVYDSDENGYFTDTTGTPLQQGGIGGGPNPYPAHYGIQSDGSALTQDYQAYAKQTSPTTFYSSAYATASVTDPSDSNYYIIQYTLADYGGGTSARLLQNPNSAGFNYYHDTSSLTFYDTALSNPWNSGSTVTPNSITQNAIVGTNAALALTDPAQVVAKSVSSPGAPRMDLVLGGSGTVGSWGLNPNNANIRFFSGIAGFEFANSPTSTPYMTTTNSTLYLNTAHANYYEFQIVDAGGNRLVYFETTNNLIDFGYGWLYSPPGNHFMRLKSPNGFTAQYIELSSTSDDAIVVRDPSGTTLFEFKGNGQTKEGNASNSSAYHNFAQGTSSLAPINIPSGTLMSSPASGNIESDGSSLYWTASSGPTRYPLAVLNASTNQHLQMVNSAGQLVDSHVTDTGTILVISGIVAEFKGGISIDNGQYISLGVATTGASNQLWSDSGKHALGYNNANQGMIIPSVFWTQSVTTTVANTTTATTLLGTGVGTKTIAANFMTLGKTFVVEGSGYLSSTISPTLKFVCNLGATAILTSAAITIAALTNAPFSFRFVFTCQATGSGGTVFAQGQTIVNSVLTQIVTTSTTAVAFNASKAIDVTAQWSTASSSDTISLSNCTITMYN